MRKTTFGTEGDLGAAAKASIDRLHHEFLAADYIRAEVVEQAAHDLGQEIKMLVAAQAASPSEKVSLILDLLSVRSILSRLSDGDYNIEVLDNGGSLMMGTRNAEGGRSWFDASYREMETYLFPIRQKILERISGHGLDIHVLTSLRSKDSPRNVWFLHDKKVLKMAREKMVQSLDPDIVPSMRKDRILALGRLYGDKKRSENILYSIVELDPVNKMEQVQSFVEFETLDRFIQRSRNMLEALEYLRDAMRGAAFLVSQGLRLTDMSLNNIAIHENHGKLFDFDGLHTDDFDVKDYFRHSHYAEAPERIAAWRDSARMGWNPVSEAEMVFELSQVLREVCERTDSPVPSLQFPFVRELNGLIDRMSKQDPAQRVSLKEAIDSLDAFLAKASRSPSS